MSDRATMLRLVREIQSADPELVLGAQKSIMKLFDDVREELNNEIDKVTAERADLETAIRAMWPIFALALAYGEHGRASEHNGLRRLAEEARNGGLPKGVLDTILNTAEEAGEKAVKQENFFDAVRGDPEMTPDQKAHWLQQEPPEPEEHCYWTPDQGYDYTAYSSSCGRSWVFEDGSPAENDMSYCPFCGKKLVVEPPTEEDEE